MSTYERTEPADWKGTARYEILSRIGRGGMGAVYEAFDRERQQPVALKTLLHFDAAALYLFKQEFRTLVGLHHSNLVHLYELIVRDGDQAFFTMELVRGADFLEYVRKGHVPGGPHSPSGVVTWRPALDDVDTLRPGAIGTERATPVPSRSPADPGRLRGALRQLVEGVEALHGAGKVHRDVKPSNVLVTPEGRVVLLDFGVAAELRVGAEVAGGDGEIVGTVLYMAPEQIGAGRPAPASDWYSVGVMLYEALVGRPPFVGPASDVLTMKCNFDPPPPSACVAEVPADLAALCMALLHRDPAARP